MIDPSDKTESTPIEAYPLVPLSLAMVVLPVLGVIGRLGNGQGIAGASVYTQHLTLWVGFLGALAATAAGRHLGLATHNLFAEDNPWKHGVRMFCSTVAAVTSMVLARASLTYVWAQRESPSLLAGGVPEWWSAIIVPVAMALITLRFIWHTDSWRGRTIALAACVGVALLFGAVDLHESSLVFWLSTLVIISAFLLGAPVFVGMSGMAMLLFFHDGTPIASVPAGTLELVQNASLPAISLLTLAGFVLASGQASERLVRFYKSLFGWMPGGLSLMAISVCALFTTFTGGSGVTILALGGLILPALVKDKYPEGFSVGLVTASGSLGLLFPPSLPVILYGAVAGVAADRLYLAGVLPGILLILVVAGFGISVGIKANAPRQDFDLREVFRALWAAKWDLGLPLVVLACFLTGTATVVEAAGIGAAYALIVELIVLREIHPLKQLPRVVAQSATLVGAVVILMGVALGLTGYLVDAQVPELLVEWVQKHFHSQWTFLLALNGMLLVLGSVFEIYAAIIVLAPLIAPLGNVFGVDPVHLGVVFLANLELGFLFPPMGLNLFLSASRFNKPLPYLYRQALPFLIIMAVGVLIITYVPAMTTGVVSLLR